MQSALDDVDRISDSELVGRLKQLVKADRVLTAKLLVHLGEVEARRLHLERGYSSMYDYCRTALGMSEAEAHLRILAASIGRKFPRVLERLGAGALHLTAIKLLAPHLTPDNHVQLLDRVSGMTKRQIEVLVADLAPKPDVPASIRKLPEPRKLFQSIAQTAGIPTRCSATLTANDPTAAQPLTATSNTTRTINNPTSAQPFAAHPNTTRTTNTPTSAQPFAAHPNTTRTANTPTSAQPSAAPSSTTRTTNAPTSAQPFAAHPNTTRTTNTPTSAQPFAAHPNTTRTTNTPTSTQPLTAPSNTTRTTNTPTSTQPLAAPSSATLTPNALTARPLAAPSSTTLTPNALTARPLAAPSSTTLTPDALTARPLTAIGRTILSTDDLASRQPLAAASDSPAPTAGAPAAATLFATPVSSIEQPLAAPAAPSALPSTFALQSPRTRATSTPLGLGRFKLQVTLGQEAQNALEQLVELFRHQNPSGDLACIVERALFELLKSKLKQRFGQTNKSRSRTKCESAPAGSDGESRGESRDAESKTESKLHSPNSRHIPVAVRRELHARDGGQCTFVSDDGRRCTERGFMEVHHHNTTFARGGKATADNLRLVCRAHNRLFAEHDYGRDFMQAKLREAMERRKAFQSLRPDETQL